MYTEHSHQPELKPKLKRIIVFLSQFSNISLQHEMHEFQKIKFRKGL